MIEKTDIGDLKGIGEKTKKLFEKINVHTVGDLIRYYPHGYDVYEEAVPISELEEDKIQTVTGAIYGRVQEESSVRKQAIWSWNIRRCSILLQNTKRSCIHYSLYMV